MGNNVVDKANIKMSDRNYTIKRYENKTILVYDEQNIKQEIKVLPFLKDIINHYKLEINLYHTNYSKNTRTLGKEVIKVLNLKKT